MYASANPRSARTTNLNQKVFLITLISARSSGLTTTCSLPFFWTGKVNTPWSAVRILSCPQVMDTDIMDMMAILDAAMAGGNEIVESEESSVSGIESSLWTYPLWVGV